jgi:predicted permease
MAFHLLLIFILSGYIVYKYLIQNEIVLTWLVRIIVHIFFPAYFFFTMLYGFRDTLELDLYWPFLFMALSACTLFFHWCMAGKLTESVADPRQKTMSRLGYTVHNAGYLPVPLLSNLVDPRVMIFLFFYIAVFNIIFWSYFTPRILGLKKTIQLNSSVIAIFTGVIAGLFSLDTLLPSGFESFFGYFSTAILAAIMVLLGMILATIPIGFIEMKQILHGEKHFFRNYIIRFILYPLILLFLLNIVLELDNFFFWSIAAVFFTEAAVPPATNLLVVAQLHGGLKEKQELGRDIFLHYVFSIVQLPVMIFLLILLKPS